MKKIFIVRISIFACLVLGFSTISNAQSVENSGSALVYLQVDDITVAKYQDLQSALKTNTTFKVKEACVPAHVISLRISGVQDIDSAIEEFKSIALTVDMKSVTHRSDYNDEKFLQKCGSARSVN